MIHSELKKIVQINTLDTVGGAACVTATLHAYFKGKGYDSKRIVGIKLGDDPDTVLLNSEAASSAGKLPVRVRGARLIPHAFRVLRHRAERFIGLEDLGDPACHYIDDILPDRDEIIICNNLHGGYFDMRELPELCRRHPVVLLLHDPWLLAGHCAHSFDCERWTSGCGDCPYPELQYALKRDTSHANWLRKKRLLESCSLYAVTPSLWLMDKVQRSILKPAVLKSRVINNGIDQGIFRPAEKKAVRAALGIAQDDQVVMFAANGIRQSIWKDYATMRAAVADAASALRGAKLRFIAVGEIAPDEEIGTASIRFLSHRSAAEMAQYYQAADLYIHAARAENFPNTVVEALSCGTPVIATAVGGIPEQVKGLHHTGDTSGLNLYGPDEATGILTPVGDSAALSRAMRHLLGNPGTLGQLSRTAATDAAARFNIDFIGARYIEFFEEIMTDWKRRQHTPMRDRNRDRRRPDAG